MSREGKSIKQKYCKKCHNLWWPRSVKKPLVCPACKNPGWDVGPKKPGGRGRKRVKAEGEDI